jgi:hypothetical protein
MNWNRMLLILFLKGTLTRDFRPLVFFRKTTPPRPPRHGLKPFSIWISIRRCGSADQVYNYTAIFYRFETSLSPVCVLMLIWMCKTPDSGPYGTIILIWNWKKTYEGKIANNVKNYVKNLSVRILFLYWYKKMHPTKCTIWILNNIHFGTFRKETGHLWTALLMKRLFFYVLRELLLCQLHFMHQRVIFSWVRQFIEEQLYLRAFYIKLTKKELRSSLCLWFVT